MPKPAVYVYDPEAGTFVAVEPNRRAAWLTAGAVVVLALVIIGAGVQALATPADAAERAETDPHLARASTAFDGLDEPARLLSRTALHARPVSDVRRHRGTASRRAAALRQQPAILPVHDGRVTSGFGMRVHPVLRVVRLHAGVDFGVATGTPVYATGDGRVSFVGTRTGYGTVVETDHPRAGRMTRFAHLTSAAPGIRVGVAVRRGQLVATSGHSGLSTAPHLHYEVRQLDEARTPTDPAETFVRGVTPAEDRAPLGAARAGTASVD